MDVPDGESLPKVGRVGSVVVTYEATTSDGTKVKVCLEDGQWVEAREASCADGASEGVTWTRRPMTPGEALIAQYCGSALEGRHEIENLRQFLDMAEAGPLFTLYGPDGRVIRLRWDGPEGISGSGFKFECNAAWMLGLFLPRKVRG